MGEIDFMTTETVARLRLLPLTHDFLGKHLQFRDDRINPEGADEPGFESFRIADH